MKTMGQQTVENLYCRAASGFSRSSLGSFSYSYLFPFWCIL